MILKGKTSQWVNALIEELERQDERIRALEDLHRVRNSGLATLCANQVPKKKKKK